MKYDDVLKGERKILIALAVFFGVFLCCYSYVFALVG